MERQRRSFRKAPAMVDLDASAPALRPRGKAPRCKSGPDVGSRSLTAPANQLLRRQTMAPTAQTDSRPATVSATIRALSSLLHFRRRLRGGITHHSRPNGQNQTAASQMSTSSGSGGKTLAMKLLAGAMLDNAMLKNVALKMETPAAKRGAAAYLRTFFERGQRRVCKALGADHASVRYRGQRCAPACANWR